MQAGAELPAAEQHAPQAPASSWMTGKPIPPSTMSDVMLNITTGSPTNGTRPASKLEKPALQKPLTA